MSILPKTLDKQNIMNLCEYIESIIIFKDYITEKQAIEIYNRAICKYNQLTKQKIEIFEFYGQAETMRLINNFLDIITYANNVLQKTIEANDFDRLFYKLNDFCGQIEATLKDIRNYYIMFGNA